MTDLLPCPFCGKNPYKRAIIEHGRYKILCTWCEASNPKTCFSEDEAIASWNIRTPPQITDAMVKTASRYGNRNPVKMYNERNALEKAIRAHDPEATEAAWEKVVQWLDLSFAALGVKR